MENYLCYLGWFIVIYVRILPGLVYRYASRSSALSRTCVAVAKTDVENADETSRLLDSNGSSGGDPGRSQSLTRKRKTACCAAAVGYITATVFAIKYSVEHHEVAPLLDDARFMYGRGGMFFVALMALFHTLRENSTLTLCEVQADGLTLLVLPFILRFIGTPGASEENAALDLVVEPMLGIVVFLSGIVF
ncbi:hypothetical protein B0H19DRAFT_1372492 [Mycena capillaripes]|nr:hypothetical protein B0H19DRAFT_1372492 [Mycena capillaripes]